MKLTKIIFAALLVTVLTGCYSYGELYNTPSVEFDYRYSEHGGVEYDYRYKSYTPIPVRQYRHYEYREYRPRYRGHYPTIPRECWDSYRNEHYYC